MFTGIVEGTGTVESIKPSAKSIDLAVRARLGTRGLQPGASVAVNGCCLTLTRRSSRGKQQLLHFDLLHETWRLTNLQFASPGALVNLERPLRLDSPLGGHVVSGHIDGVGRIERWEKSGADHVLDIVPSAGLMRYIVHKGSIAVDGISLTVAAVRKRSFRIWIIPHTFNVTTLRERRVGDAVNLEADLLAKYVEKLLAARAGR
jgi:riboflavin synthase